MAKQSHQTSDGSVKGVTEAAVWDAWVSCLLSNSGNTFIRSTPFSLKGTVTVSHSWNWFHLDNMLRWLEISNQYLRSCELKPFTSVSTSKWISLNCFNSWKMVGLTFFLELPNTYSNFRKGSLYNEAKYNLGKVETEPMPRFCLVSFFLWVGGTTLTASTHQSIGIAF